MFVFGLDIISMARLPQWGRRRGGKALLQKKFILPCLQQFYGTEAAFLAVLFTFNLLRLYQHRTTPQQHYRRPATLRTQVFVAGAFLAHSGKQLALKPSQAWGGLAKHKPLLEAVLQWPKLTSQKLAHPEAPIAVNGGFV